MGELLPAGASVQGFWDQYGTRILYGLAAYMIFRFIAWLLAPSTRVRVVKKAPPPKKEGFQPREETDDSWLRL